MTMTFWEKIKAASSLTVGTVWERISHPKTGGAGGIIYIEQVRATVDNETALTAIPEEPITSSVTDSTITSTVTVFDAVTNIPDNIVSVEVV